ncbi:MAG TPA: YciI family protein [Pyrinomonadaceae bacterium]
MNEEFEDELSAEERKALGGLVREKMPPPALEERIVETLKRSQMLSPSQNITGLRAPRFGLAIAASLLFFMLGALAGAKWFSSSEQKSNAQEFMLVLRSAPEKSPSDSSGEVMQRVREYGNWAGQLRQQGVRASGERLKSEARVLRTTNGRAVVSETPAWTSAETIAGYFLIEARDYEQALKIAEGCPHLKYGGTIEVRQIARF